jgi:CRISPR-associated exonuclease Cas4
MTLCREDELFSLPVLEHLLFCEQQWALIHIEQVRPGNSLNERRRIMHDRIH